MVQLPRIAPVDPYTVALYRFDSQVGNQVRDEVGVSLDTPLGLHPGTLYGSATITSSGLYDGALWVDGNNSYVQLGNLGNLPHGTIEAFVDFSTLPCVPGEAYSVVSAGGEYGSHQDILKVEQSGGFVFAIFANGEWHWADSGINACRYLAGPSGPLWPYETWRFHHVAVTWGAGGRGMEIWVDGVLHGVGMPNPTPANSTYLYWCSPQMQMNLDPDRPNDVYPECKTPEIGEPAPGSYEGGLPTYITFLVGCDSSVGFDPSRKCFRGRIDELRISNVQRTFGWGVVPTSSPTPTQTPDRIGAEYAVDSATLGLYHLTDGGPTGWGAKNEVTQQYDGGLHYPAAYVPGGHFGNALSLDGNNSYVKTGGLGNPSAGAVEAWVYLNGSPWAITVVHAGGDRGSNINRLHLGTYGQRIGFGMTYPGEDPYNPPWATVQTDVDAAVLVGSWHHIAGTWGARGYEVWLDGQLCASRSFVARMPDPIETFLIGCDSLAGCMQGVVDEVRISNVQRSYSPLMLGLMRSPALTATRFLPTSTPRVSARSPAEIFEYFFPFLVGVPTPVPCGPYLGP